MDSILEKVQKNEQLLPDEFRTLVGAFASPQDQPKAYLALSLLWQNPGEGEGSSSVEQLVRVLGGITSDYLSETNEPALICGITFMTALYRVDADSAFSLFSTEGTLENVMDSVEITPSPQLSIAAARLLAETCGHKKSRAILTTGVRQWLDAQSKQTKDSHLAASSAVALIKLWHGASSDKIGETATDSLPDIDADSLVSQMKAMVVSGSDHSALAEAVEGLAYLSTKPPIKEALSKDAPFLKKLLESIPLRKGSTSQINSALLYGIVTIIHNLSRYRPILNEEQRQIEKLRKMANTSQGLGSEEDSTFDNKEYVKNRIHRLIGANVLPVLSVVAILSESPAIQADVGKMFLNIVEEKEVRGQVLQSGGAKALRSIIKRLSPKGDNNFGKWLTAPVVLEPIQALAKLTITSPPIHVYGPDIGAIIDAIRPLSLLVLHQSANQLQQFEGMMALTNLASHSPDVSDRIAKVDGLLNRVELLLLEEHTLVCRASMELICNLISGSEKAFERYAGDGTTNKAPTSKIHVLLALCDIDDVPTRLAASGALAVLASSERVCHALLALQLEKGRFFPIMDSLLSPIPQNDGEPTEDANLIHRAAVCLQNFLSQIDSDQLLKTKTDLETLQKTMMSLIVRSKSLNLGPALPPLKEAVRLMLKTNK